MKEDGLAEKDRRGGLFLGALCDRLRQLRKLLVQFGNQGRLTLAGGGGDDGEARGVFCGGVDEVGQLLQLVRSALKPAQPGCGEGLHLVALSVQGILRRRLGQGDDLLPELRGTGWDSSV